MVKKGQKRALLDAFPAWIVWLQRPGEQPYYKVQPDFKGEVLSHSLTPEGEAHARLWRESEEVPGTSRFVPASAIRHIELKAGKPALLSCPPSTATVSFAPVNYDSFEFKAVKRLGGLEVTTSNKLWLSAVCWETEASFFRPIKLPGGGLATESRS